MEINEYAFSIPEINYQILRSVHPYYMKDICNTNTTFLQQCDDNKYEILQTWVYPQLSIKEIRKKLPKITFSDVVELSLVYNPIPESVNYYDCYTLFLHACKQNQQYPEDYISKSGDPRDAHGLDSVSTVLWICYKFNRADVIRRWLSTLYLNSSYIEQFNKMINFIDIKLGGGYLVEQGTIYLSWLIKLFDMSMIFTNDELLEILMIASRLDGNKGYRAIDYIMNVNINTGTNYLFEFTSTLVHYMPKSDVLRIVSQYYPDITEIPNIEYPVINIKRTALSRYDTKPTVPRLYFNRETLVPKYIPQIYRGIYYVTSGLYASYINWKRKGYSINDKSAFQYFFMAPWGYFSLNADLCKAYNIPIDYYNINKLSDDGAKNLLQLPNPSIYKMPGNAAI